MEGYVHVEKYEPGIGWTWNQEGKIEILTLELEMPCFHYLKSCMSCKTLLNHPVPQFLELKCGDININNFIRLLGGQSKSN